MKTLREWIDLINEAQKSDNTDEIVALDEDELEETFISKALPTTDNPIKKKAKNKIEYLTQKT
jgi:hypothetical protein